jgi:O-antigen/teichoic acid export membrane protein
MKINHLINRVLGFRYLGHPMVETLSHAKNYFSVSVFRILLSFILTPILTYHLTTEEYGFYSIILSWIPLLVVLFTLDTPAALDRYFFDKKINFPSFLGTNIFVSTLLMILFCIYASLNQDYLSGLLEIPQQIMPVLILLIFVTLFNNIFFEIMKNSRESKKLLYLNTGIPIVGLVVTIISVYFLKNNLYWAPIYGSFTTSVILFFYSIKKLALLARFTIQLDYIKKIFIYSLPLILAHTSAYALEKIDTILIAKYTTVANAGLYSYAYKIGMLPWLGVSAILTAWRPKYYEYMDQKQYDSHDKDVSTISWLFVVLFSFFILFGDILGKMLAPDKFHDSLILIPLIAMGYFFLTSYEIYKRNFIYEKQTSYVFSVHILSGVVNIFLNIIFIPIYGYKVAALTTIFSYALLFLFGFLSSKYLFTGRHTSGKILAGPFLSLCVIFLINYGFQYLLVSALFKIVVFISIVAAIIKWKFNFFKSVSNG